MFLFGGYAMFPKGVMNDVNDMWIGSYSPSRDLVNSLARGGVNKQNPFDHETLVIVQKRSHREVLKGKYLQHLYINKKDSSRIYE